jgi:hypothetical protein
MLLFTHPEQINTRSCLMHVVMKVVKIKRTAITKPSA